MAPPRHGTGDPRDNRRVIDRARRRELRDAVRSRPPDAGIYAIRHSTTGRSIVAATLNLPGARNRFDFALQTGSIGAIDGLLSGDVRAHGIGGLEFEVLETVPVEAGRSEAELRADLATLETLWREKLGVDSGRSGS